MPTWPPGALPSVVCAQPKPYTALPPPRPTSRGAAAWCLRASRCSSLWRVPRCSTAWRWRERRSARTGGCCNWLAGCFHHWHDRSRGMEDGPQHEWMGGCSLASTPSAACRESEETLPLPPPLPCALPCRLSALYRYNTDIDGSLDFSSWAAFTASALEVRLSGGCEGSRRGTGAEEICVEAVKLFARLEWCGAACCLANLLVSHERHSPPPPLPPRRAGHQAERHQHPVRPGGGAGQLAGHGGGAQGAPCGEWR